MIIVKKRKLVDTSELCEQFNVCRTTLYYWRKKGVIPYYKIGGSVKYDLDEVLQHLRNNNLVN